MELTVYRQSSKQRPDGTIVYKGEDALPYVDDTFFVVADGLGGAASIRNQKINPALFEKDKIMDTLFQGVYDDYSDERFVKYVTDSFFELFAVKECYTENINNIKKSGYFASRIVTAIVLHEHIYNEKLNPNELFDRFNKLESEETKEGFLKELGKCFAQKIENDIRKIAKNANLIYESSYTGLALLGSTLCATIYRENEENVEALYLTAGDSRPYLWTPKDGLCQIVEDQEGSDGGMTNYIKANAEKTFDIRCNYMQFHKPCVMFNASDGCFDSGYFLSQMAFEKLILDKALESNSTVEMGKSIHDVFLTYGKHDDSSTIAMVFLGFKTFDDFKQSADNRLREMSSLYFSKMPDLLEHDYIADYEEERAKIPSWAKEIKPMFQGEDAVKRYCIEYVKKNPTIFYSEELLQVDNKIAILRQEIEKEKDTIESIVVRHYSLFLPLCTHKERLGERFTVSKVQNIQEKYEKQSCEYLNLIKRYQQNHNSTADSITQVINHYLEIGIPSDFSDFESSDAEVKECENSMISMFGFFDSVRKKKQSNIRSILQLRNEYISHNKKLAYGDESRLKEIVEILISGHEQLHSLSFILFQDDYETLSKSIQRISQLKQEIETFQTDEKAKLLLHCAEEYWEKHYVEIIPELVNDAENKLPENLCNLVRDKIAEAASQESVIKSKGELQSELFKSYDLSYSRYLGGNNQ